jgi:hypothetical protein
MIATSNIRQHNLTYFEKNPKTEATGNEPPAKKRKTVAPEEQAPNVIAIEATPDGSHAVIITGEDKSVRVFEVSDQGVLTEKSQRFRAFALKEANS